MSSLFNHAFIPLVLLLVFSKKFKISPTNIFPLVIFGILPDADIFLEHRALLHNLFVVLIPFLLFLFLKGRREIMGIICFYLASHIILDIFNGGVYIFYPLYEKLFFVQAEIAFQNNMILPKLDFGFSSMIINNGRGEPIISSENLAVTSMILITAAASLIWKNKYFYQK